MVGEKSIFLLGIKGVAMANLAVILQKMGKKVTGSDTQEIQITDEQLLKNKIPLSVGFDPADLSADIELLIYSASHGGDDNPQVVEAIRRGIKVMHQAQFLGELLKGFKTTIAVCGSHGKTTTSSLLAYALLKLGAKPSYLVGSSSFNEYPGGDYQSSDYFVIEADEYGVNPPKDKTPKFHFLNPDYLLVTNIDFDHPDVFDNLDHAKQAFKEFFKKAKKLILGPENEGSNLRISNIRTEEGYSVFELLKSGDSQGEFKIALFGEKLLSNAAGAIGALFELGFKANQIKDAVKNFSGAKRRFEKKFFENDTYLFDDYAHHPEEIKAIIKAARDRFKGKRIVVLFQSHTYSRTKAFLNEFGEALSEADYSLIAPIFPSARENPAEFNVSQFDIARAAKKGNLKAFETTAKLIEEMRNIITKGDVIFTMGAGDIYKLESDIIDLIKRLN